MTDPRTRIVTRSAHSASVVDLAVLPPHARERLARYLDAGLAWTIEGADAADRARRLREGGRHG